MSSAQQIPPPPPRPGTVVIEHPKVPGSWKIVREEDFDPSRMTPWKEIPDAVQEKRQRQEVRPPIPPPARSQEPPPPPPPAPGIPRRGRARAKALAVLLGFSWLLSAGIVSAGPVSILGFAKISATQTNTTTTLTTPSSALTIYNAGTNEVFVALGSAATTSSAEIPPGFTLTINDVHTSSVGVICSTGETATVYLYAGQQ